MVSTEKKKKSTTSKLRVIFYSVGQTEDISLRHIISDNSERLLQSDKGGARIYRSFCNKDKVVRT